MKKLIVGVMLLGILGACGNKKTNIDPFASITKEVDSIRQIADSSHHDKSPEDPQPIQASPNRQKRTNLSTILSIILLPMMCYSVSV